MNDQTNTSFFGRLAGCPTCDSERLETVIENGTADVHFFCTDCARCWHLELGHVRRVAPTTCLGCPYRDQCGPVYAADHSR